MKIKLLANPKKVWAKELAKKVSIFLKKSSHSIVKSGADITLCIGGDGTILYANHQDKLEGTILAIGSSKSYICQLNADNWKDLILDIISKNKLIAVSTLSLTILNMTTDVVDSETKMTSFSALNDFVVHSKDYRVLPIKISIYDRNKKPLNPPFGDPRCLSISKEFLGDGLIISSPLGSSAYAYSAGGSKLPLHDQKIELVPICPYKRTLDPFSIDDKQIIQIEVKKSCALIADGIFIKHIKDSILEIKKSKKMILFEGVGRND